MKAPLEVKRVRGICNFAPEYVTIVISIGVGAYWHAGVTGHALLPGLPSMSGSPKVFVSY